MADRLEYPDLDPAPGWTGYRAGTQQRYLPPSSDPQSARAAIIISPLIARTDRLPPPAALIEQTLEAEVRVNGVVVEERDGPTELVAASGLSGVSYQARVRGRTGIERRIYVLLSDDSFYYGISYLAAEDLFDRHEQEFWTMARSIRSFHRAPDPSPFGHYGE